MKVEYIVDTIKDYIKVKEYLEHKICSLNFSFVSVFCLEDKTTHIFKSHKLKDNMYIYYES